MTEQEILNEASRIERRRALVQKIEREFAKRVQLVSFDGPNESARFEIDETCLGFIKAHLLAEFDRMNKPLQKSEEAQVAEKQFAHFVSIFEKLRKDGAGQ